MSADVTFFEDTPFFSSSVDHSSSLQDVLPIPCPLGNSNQNVNEVSSSLPNSIEVASPPLLTYHRRTRPADSTMPEPLLVILILLQPVLQPWILLPHQSLITLSQTDPLPSEKVLDPLVTLILFITF